MEKYVAEFDCVVADVLRITKESQKGRVTAQTLERLENVIRYNVPNQNSIRGILVPAAYQAIVGNPSEEQMKLARILGWIFQMHQTFFVIADDIMDGGDSRWGKKCWHRLQLENPLVAVNDSLLLEHATYLLIRHHFGDIVDDYAAILDMFHEVTYKLCLGQNTDLMCESSIQSAAQNEQSVSSYQSMIECKSGYAFIYLPLCLAMHLAGVKKPDNRELWEDVHKITVDIGAIFQIQDDYLDWCGPADKMEQYIDIKSGKHTWFYLNAMELGDHVDRQIMLDNYGKGEESKEENVEAVLEVYKRLKLDKLFKDYERQCCANIYDAAEQLSKKSSSCKKIADVLLYALKEICKMTE